MNEAIVSIETSDHAVELFEGCLTIATKSFPDSCISLSAEETAQVLRFIVAWTLAENFKQSSIPCPNSNLN